MWYNIRVLAFFEANDKNLTVWPAIPMNLFSFGLSFDMEGNAMIAKASAGAAIGVKVTWKRGACPSRRLSWPGKRAMPDHWAITGQAFSPLV